MVRAIALIFSLAGTACAVSPGMHMQKLGGSSRNQVLHVRGDEHVAERVSIQAITPDLIMRQDESDARASAPSGAPVEDYEYRVGPGDVLTITVWDHPELTIPAGEFRSAESSGTLIDRSGSIFYPFAGSIPVSGLTTGQIREELRNRLSRYIENVQLDVRVAAFRSQKVFVVGEVVEPGMRQISDVPLRVIDAINKSAGFTEGADRRNVTLTRDGQTYRVDVLALYETGDLSHNALLRDGDVVYVPDLEFDKIFVMGEVLEPASYFMQNGRKTLAEAISDAGGLDPAVAAAGRVFVIRAGDSPEIFQLDARSPDALLLADRFSLKPRDVVYVGATDPARYNRLIVQLLPTVEILQKASRTDFPLFNGLGRAE